jgi:hypothetical protein
LALAAGCSLSALSQQGSGLGKANNDTLIKNQSGDSKGFRPIANLNSFYRVYVGLSYQINNQHGENAVTDKHTIGLNYSITEKSFHPYYKAIFPAAVAGWNLSLLAGYDGVRRVNFFGLGNESLRHPSSERFNWLRTENLYTSVGFDKTIAFFHFLQFNILYDAIKVYEDANRIAVQLKPKLTGAEYSRQSFLGSRVGYTYQKLSSQVIAEKGVEFSASAAYTENLQRRAHSFARFTTDVDVYVPLRRKLSAVIRSGLAAMTGNPDFYQLNTLGGTNTIRGYQRFRFYGKTAFYNQNELRWLTSIATKPFAGQVGVFALFDQGRVWHPGEASNKLHFGYGGGIILAPGNKVVVTGAYAMSNEDKRVHLSIRRVF